MKGPMSKADAQRKAVKGKRGAVGFTKTRRKFVQRNGGKSDPPVQVRAPYSGAVR